MPVTMTCANKYAQQPGVKGSPIMVVFNGPNGSVLHLAFATESDANQYKLQEQYQLIVTGPIE